MGCLLHRRNRRRATISRDLRSSLLVLLVRTICLAFYLSLTSRYATAGLDLSAGAAGPVFLTMFFYEMLYTGIGKCLGQAWSDTTAQFIAAYSPNAPFAALLIPVVIAVLVTFSGVLIPYSQLTVFWKYWRKSQLLAWLICQCITSTHSSIFLEPLCHSQPGTKR